MSNNRDNLSTARHRKGSFYISSLLLEFSKRLFIFYLKLHFTENIHGKKALWRSPECGLSHLYSAVTPVSYDDVPVGVHSHTSGSVELAVAFTMRAKFEQEFSICIVHLKGGGGQSSNTFCLHLLVHFDTHNLYEIYRKYTCI